MSAIAQEAVTVDDVSFSYGVGLPVLDGFTCSVRRGEILSVVGPSGCGKSTLLRLIGGLLLPSSGRVALHNGLTDTGRCVAMVFQEDVLLPWLSVRRNVAMAGTFARTDKSVMRARVDELLSLVGLSAYADFYPRQLSGGMRRRIGVLQPLAAHPEVLLMDEPFSSIDEPTRILIHNDVRRLLKRLGTTTVLVTHDLAEAVSLSDRVAVVSGRPSHVVAEHSIDLGTDRNMLELRQERAYLDTYRELWEALRHEIIGDDAPGAVS